LIDFLLAQTLQTLEVMHKEKVAFTDLKPGNLFLLGGIRICLSDIKSLIPYDHPEPTYENTSPLASSLTSDNLEENYNPEQEELPLLTPVFAPPEAYKNANYKNANIKWLRQGYDWCSYTALNLSQLHSCLMFPPVGSWEVFTRLA